MMDEQNPELIQILSPRDIRESLSNGLVLCRCCCHLPDRLTSILVELTLERGLSWDSRYLFVISDLQLTFCVYGQVI